MTFGGSGNKRDFAAGDSNPPRHRVFAASQAKLLDLAAEAMHDGVFGLHLAELSDPRDTGIFLCRIGGGKRRRSAGAVRSLLPYRQQGRSRCRFEFVGLPKHEVRQGAEFGIAVMLKALRQFAGQNIRPTRAAFAHGRNHGG
jgi:hypothetical protein